MVTARTGGNSGRRRLGGGGEGDSTLDINMDFVAFLSKGGGTCLYLFTLYSSQHNNPGMIQVHPILSAYDPVSAAGHKEFFGSTVLHGLDDEQPLGDEPPS